MIYWFTGPTGAGKTTLANKLKDLLQTEKRNWRKNVFYIDGESYTVEEAQLIAEYINKNECDIVVSIKSPIKAIRTAFKDKMGKEVVELYIYTTKKKKDEPVEYYEVSDEDYIDINTASENAIQSFTKIVYSLRETNSI
jgi:hypothetical protein